MGGDKARNPLPHYLISNREPFSMDQSAIQSRDLEVAEACPISQEDEDVFGSG